MLKSNGHKLIVGYDLGWEYAQISYYSAGCEKTESIYDIMGSDSFSVPAVLCKRVGVNQWFYGKEALKHADDQDGILVEHLLQLALDGEPVRIEETEYDPVALLTLFFKRSLGVLPVNSGSSEKIEAMMITCEQMDEKMAEILDKVAANMRVGTDRIFYQSYQESYFYYMLIKNSDLMREPSMLFAYQGSRMISFQMECNKKTKPQVVFIHRQDDEFPSRSSLSGNQNEGNRVLDQNFLLLTKEKLEKCDIVSGHCVSVYLIGDDFSEEWLKDSLKYLCERRRIFMGNNLFSKGACCGMLERTATDKSKAEFVFLGEDKLCSNIGMRILKEGEETYLALLDAGIEWRKAKTTLEFYLREEKQVELTITSLSGGGKREIPIELEGFTADIARIRMVLWMKNKDILCAEFEDLGFGEFRPAESRKWKQEIDLNW